MFHHPQAIVDAAWLQANLADPRLRIYDCTTKLQYEEGTGRPYRPVSRRDAHDAGHIPGAGYLDLQAEFSDPDSPYSFTLPRPEVLARAFGAAGIGPGTRVVLYSRGSLTWATRFWWMLRWIGFDDAAILDGGFDGWEAEGRPVSTDRCTYPAADLTAAPRPGLFVGKDAVSAAIGDAGICTLNALSAEMHGGGSDRYGRPGRIPGSVNVPAASLVEPGTLTLAAPDRVAEAFAAVGAGRDRPVIAYCGGGIAATLDAFLLYQLGHRDIAVYDNSMSEWAKDPALPIETD